MKLTIKSIKQQAYEVEVTSQDILVKELKKEIEARHGFESSTLKLLYKGTLLDDAKTLKDYNIAENEVLVMMNMKAKPINVPKEEEKKAEQLTDTKLTSSTTTNKPSTTVKPEKDYTAQIKQLSEMGFSAEESKNSIKAARGNVELAIEFLYNGIPDNLPNEEELVQGGEEGGNSPDKLLKTFASVIKVACQGNPGNLSTIMGAMEQSQPELVALIRQNEEQFRNLISQPVTEEDMRTFQTFTQQGRQGGQGIPGGQGGQGGQGAGRTAGSTSQSTGGTSGQQQAGRGQIKLTKEEFEAINRLKVFGFSEIDCVQAYFAFDKNEEQALNFLFDNKQQEEFSNLNIQNQGQNQNQSSTNQSTTNQVINQTDVAQNKNVSETTSSNIQGSNVEVKNDLNVNQENLGNIEQNIKKDEDKKNEENK